MHTVFAFLCFVMVIHWLIFPYPSGLLHWHCGNLTIAPVPAKQPWWIWINTSCEFIMNDCITTTKQSTTKPCAYFLGYTVYRNILHWTCGVFWMINLRIEYLRCQLSCETCFIIKRYFAKLWMCLQQIPIISCIIVLTLTTCSRAVRFVCGVIYHIHIQPTTYVAKVFSR